jgi:hypothetical protein
VDNLLLETGYDLLLEDTGLVLLEIQVQTVSGDLRWASGLGPRRKREDDEPTDEQYDEEDDVAALLLVS